MWDAGTGTTDVELVSGMIFTYTIIGAEQHKDYRFKVQAWNIYGYGDFSPVTVISTTDIPSLMEPVTVTYDANKDIDITWVEPANGGSPITRYEIRLFVPNT